MRIAEFAAMNIVVALGATAAVATTQSEGPSPVNYWISAETGSGLAAAAFNNISGSASVNSALSGTGGSRRPSFAHNLSLQLGSARRVNGTPASEHFPPARLQVGASLPLVTPQAVRGSGAQPSASIERPRGRMLIYWGCGERARPGQPTVVDFSSMVAGQVPPALRNLPFTPMMPPSTAAVTTYGEWPNPRSQVRVPAGGSLIGVHTLRSNYSPEIHFTIDASQDFLAPIALTSNRASASGSIPLAWRSAPGARAWFAVTMGAAQNGDFVLWTSSETQAAMMVDYVPGQDLDRMVQSRVLMPSNADRCVVPAEVARAAPQSMLSLTAFGEESNFSQSRPATAGSAWRPDWTVKLRRKSSYMGLLGMDMPDMG